MKISSNLLGAMVLCATLGAVTSSCTTTKVQTDDIKNSEKGGAVNEGLSGKIHNLFSPRPDPCPTCGMG